MDLEEVEFVAEAPRSTSLASLPSQASKVADDSQEKEDNLMEQNNNVLKEAGVESSKKTVPSVPLPPSPSAEEEAAVLEANQAVSASFSCVKCTAKAKTYTSENQLYCHYITKHYIKKIETFMSNNGDTGCGTCKLCGKQMQRIKLALHIGISHHVIQDLLTQEGIVVHPQPSSSSSDHVAGAKSDGRVPAQDNQTMLPPITDPSNGPVASGNMAVDLLGHPSAEACVNQGRLEENAEYVEWSVDLLGQPPAPTEAEATVNQRRQGEDAESSGSGSHVGCNFSLTCEVCSQKFRAQHSLQQHYVRHFHEEVNEEANRYFRNFVKLGFLLAIFPLEILGSYPRM